MHTEVWKEPIWGSRNKQKVISNIALPSPVPETAWQSYYNYFVTKPTDAVRKGLCTCDTQDITFRNYKYQKL